MLTLARGGPGPGDPEQEFFDAIASLDLTTTQVDYLVFVLGTGY